MFLTWDGDPGNGIAPRRPSTDDLGGDQKQDDQEFPPDIVLDPTADGWNQMVDQVAAIAKVVPSARVQVHFVTGTPTAVAVAACADVVTTGTFTVTHPATGIVLVAWPANTFPPASVPPWATLLGTTSLHVDAPVVEILTNSCKVHTSVNGVATDMDFVLHIHGG